MKTVQDLIDFHRSIMDQMATYKPPGELFVLMDDNFRSYMNGAPEHRYYWWLALAVRGLGPNNVLELGTAVGASSIMMASEAKWLTPIKMVSIDLLWNARFVPDSIKEIVDYREADANVSETYAGMEDVDFLFLDTDHMAKDLRNQLVLTAPILKRGALVVLDDIHMNDMSDAWNEITWPKLDITADCHPSGFGIFVFNPEE